MLDVAVFENAVLGREYTIEMQWFSTDILWDRVPGRSVRQKGFSQHSILLETTLTRSHKTKYKWFLLVFWNNNWPASTDWVVEPPNQIRLIRKRDVIGVGVSTLNRHWNLSTFIGFPYTFFVMTISLGGGKVWSDDLYIHECIFDGNFLITFSC